MICTIELLQVTMRVANSENPCYTVPMELVQLRQLVAISEEKVLSRAAERLNISQPALSRSIQKLEDELGIALFDRKKNSMTLNGNGEAITERARAVLSEADALVKKAGSLKSQRRSLAVVTCAPAPLWKLSAEAETAFPSLAVQGSLVDENEIVSLLLSERAFLAIVRTEIDSESIETVPFMDEQLFMQIPADDDLSKRSEIRFADLAGRTIREYTETGFWHKVHRDSIPDAQYIEYSDFMIYMNVVKSPDTLTFVTELGHTKSEAKKGCHIVPITDESATAHYRLAYLRKNKAELADIVAWAVNAAKGW